MRPPGAVGVSEAWLRDVLASIADGHPANRIGARALGL
jgi:hypothetical protein